MGSAHTDTVLSFRLMADTHPRHGAPIPVCAGCGLEPVPGSTVLCTLCTAHLATSTPLPSAAPTIDVAAAFTMRMPRYVQAVA